MAYSNRTDLNNAMNKKVAVQTATGQTYGKASEQRRAQQAMPIGASPSDVAPSQGVAPGSLGAFNRPTERPAEPITAGVNFGDGPNAIQAGVNQPIRTEDPVLDRLKTIFEQFPNDELADLLDSYIRDGY
jgi:hypothetical protein